MKIPSPQIDITRWHHVFAWLPTQIGNEIVWLQWIERKANGWDPTIGLYGVEYRALCE